MKEATIKEIRTSNPADTSNVCALVDSTSMISPDTSNNLSRGQKELLKNDILIYDSLTTAKLLTEIKNDYDLALKYIQQGDTISALDIIRSAVEKLDEVSRTSEIELNKDFESISANVLLLYQKYVSKFDSLFQETSLQEYIS
ncbi:MAG: hypothetical protein ABDI07_07870, partial [Candidatus Kryptonium sp.]